MPFDAFSYLGGMSRVRPGQLVLGAAIGPAPHALAVPLPVGLLLPPTLDLVSHSHTDSLHGLGRRVLATPVSVEPVPVIR